MFDSPIQNQDRHSRFRYHGMARLSNLLSNNSNVFAVWITLGYFEVEPNPTQSRASTKRILMGSAWARNWAPTPDRSSGIAGSISSTAVCLSLSSQARTTTWTTPSSCDGTSNIGATPNSQQDHANASEGAPLGTPVR